MKSDRILSRNETVDVILNILFLVDVNVFSFDFCIIQHSVPYISPGLTAEVYVYDLVLTK